MVMLVVLVGGLGNFTVIKNGMASRAAEGDHVRRPSGRTQRRRRIGPREGRRGESARHDGSGWRIVAWEARTIGGERRSAPRMKRHRGKDLELRRRLMAARRSGQDGACERGRDRDGRARVAGMDAWRSSRRAVWRRWLMIIVIGTALTCGGHHDGRGRAVHRTGGDARGLDGLHRLREEADRNLKQWDDIADVYQGVMAGCGTPAGLCCSKRVSAAPPPAPFVGCGTPSGLLSLESS